MNLFEKIFNYQIISRLDDSGTFMITSQERAWLKTMLEHPAATAAFPESTLHKLKNVLEQDSTLDFKEHFIEKGRSIEKHVYHPLLRSCRRFILNKSSIVITYRLKGGSTTSAQNGVPYKLEYSMVKKEWYLLWYHLRHRSLMNTRLDHIVSVSEQSTSPEVLVQAFTNIQQILDKLKDQVILEVVNTYNQELSRILYAFSCFEKEVIYDATEQIYTICLSFIANEREYVLSKIRFLGKRVRIIEGDYLKKRMLESSRKALERYRITSPPIKDQHVSSPMDGNRLPMKY
ncbi:WYL domain-containing protein [Paenibacillus sp. IHBB 10380]|uniref:WYL domain-containing protein n=1 Tax=Paenibacillus sp. IHBB 10380 TaxID=1566358 RepID=UPI0005CFD1A6|nr:WYL domain-containing protein [Paenibacillus sp. IHBB 10380]